MTRETVAVELEGIPETLLWTLYQRAVEARRPGALIHDPQAVELVARIDYPFEERFGHGFGQWQALRARRFDDAVRAFLATHPDGMVVALGEGLKRTRPGWRARRWVVEACHSWLNRNRALLIRWSKKPENHLALLQLACGLIAFKKAHAARLAHGLVG